MQNHCDGTSKLQKSKFWNQHVQFWYLYHSALSNSLHPGISLARSLFLYIILVSSWYHTSTVSQACKSSFILGNVFRSEELVPNSVEFELGSNGTKVKCCCSETAPYKLDCRENGAKVM